ncbi:hypothetical protein CW304_18025 [Bacillus sp. UFRGS-B20]|nr:hypothetical protein CW304_18025 [Bacillus sp. UFRGS-B20]
MHFIREFSVTWKAFFALENVDLFFFFVSLLFFACVCCNSGLILFKGKCFLEFRKIRLRSRLNSLPYCIETIWC